MARSSLVLQSLVSATILGSSVTAVSLAETYYPVEAETSSVTIQVSNAAEHGDWLLPEQQQILQRFGDFSFNVNSGSAESGPSPGIPVEEAVQRHLERCQGPALYQELSHYLVYPNGLVRRTEEQRWSRFQDSPYRESVWLPLWPLERKGQVLLSVQQPESRQRSQWRYIPADRVVRREGERRDNLPNEAFYGQRQEQDSGLFDGRADAYQWRWETSRLGLILDGEAASQALSDNRLDDLLGAKHPDPGAMAWQPHWLWVARGLANNGQGSVNLYLDPSTGTALAVGHFDSKGTLQRWGYAPLVSAPPPCIQVQGEAWLWDLDQGNYSIENVKRAPDDYSVQFSEGFFNPNQLRQVGKR